MSKVSELDVLDDNDLIEAVYLDDVCNCDGQVLAYITDSYDSVSDVFHLIRFVLDLAYSDDAVPLKSENFISLVDDRGFIKGLPHHRKMCAAFNAIKRVRFNLDSYSFHPAFKLLTDILDSGFMSSIDDYGRRSEANCKAYVESWLSVIGIIRDGVNGTKFKIAVNEYQRSSRKNHKSVLDYIDSLFYSYAKILVIRIDLSYKLGINVDSLRVRKDRERLFLNAKSNRIFTNMIGFVWKLEVGLYKGFHYHMLFFFDGSKVREDINISRRIGEYWVGDITKNDGLYFNCNRVKNKYKHCGIGLISYFDEQKRSYLKDAVKYLTLTEKYLKPMNESGFRCLGKGVPKKQVEKLGRPRLHESIADHRSI